MKHVDEARIELRRAVAQARTDQGSDVGGLSSTERQLIDAGLEVVDDVVGAACRRVLDDWDNLDSEARITALLVLANALAERDTERRKASRAAPLRPLPRGSHEPLALRGDL